MSDGRVSRRHFLRDAAAGVTAFIAVGCSPHHRKASLAFPAPSSTEDSGFGGRIDAGPVDHVRATIERTGEPYYVPEARAYVNPFPIDAVEQARKIYPPESLAILEAGLVVLYQRCTHLGCRVPWCTTSRWFECPCHVARYDGVGECRAGPAPRGLDLMKATIEKDRLVIDTGMILQGVPNGTNTTHQSPAGPFCVG